MRVDVVESLRHNSKTLATYIAYIDFHLSASRWFFDTPSHSSHWTATAALANLAARHAPTFAFNFTHSLFGDSAILILMGSVPTTVGPYRIIRQLGEGGMGSVFEGLHEAIERRVAIKTLKPEYTNNRELIARFFNEARAVNRVEHPSLVQISDYGQTPDGVVYLVMEYLRGVMLRTRLDQLFAAKQVLPLEQLLQFSWQVAEALTATHAKGIIHRDLKPENIMLVSDPAVPGGERAKILDFGIAKLHAASQVMTAPSRLMGTPRYMSPEQCRGAGNIDGRTDVYALGTLMYEMVASQPPFGGDSMEGVLAQHLFRNPDPLNSLAPHVDPRLADLVHQMLLKEPNQRPTMAEAEAALKLMLLSLSQSQPVTRLTPQIQGPQEPQPQILLNSTLRQSIGQHGRLSTRQHRAGWLPLGGALLAGFVAIAWTYLPTHSPVPSQPASPPKPVPPMKSVPSAIQPLATERSTLDIPTTTSEEKPVVPVTMGPGQVNPPPSGGSPDAKPKEKKPHTRKPEAISPTSPTSPRAPTSPISPRSPPPTKQPPQTVPSRRNMYDGIL